MYTPPPRPYFYLSPSPSHYIHYTCGRMEGGERIHVIQRGYKKFLFKACSLIKPQSPVMYRYTLKRVINVY